MPHEVHPRFFAIFGLLLGALYGLILSVWAPSRTASINDLYNPVMWAMIILSFFVLQYGLGVLLNKPIMSREIYFGIFLIPITYTATVASISIPNFFRTFVAFEVPALVLFMTSFYIVSPFLAFFTGFDTKALDDAKIPAETVFSFDIQHSTINETEDLKLVARMVHGMGFTISLKNIADNEGLIICRKEKMYLGIFCELKDQILRATFVPFKLANDTVEKVQDIEEILDFKAQISGMLYAWMQNNLILRFNEISPNLELGFKKVSEGLGPSKTPFNAHIRDTIGSFPKNHPYQLALLTTGFVAIVNVMLFILGKLVFA